MACPYFRIRGGRCECAAIAKAVIPSASERERLCAHKWQFVRCEMYRRSCTLGRPVSEAEWVRFLFDGSA